MASKAKKDQIKNPEEGLRNELDDLMNSMPDMSDLDSEQMESLLNDFYVPIQDYDNKSFVTDCSLKEIFDETLERVSNEGLLKSILGDGYSASSVFSERTYEDASHEFDRKVFFNCNLVINSKKKFSNDDGDAILGHVHNAFYKALADEFGQENSALIFSRYGMATLYWKNEEIVHEIISWVPTDCKSYAYAPD